MRTVAVKAVVSADQELRIRVPMDVPPGEHEVVVVIDDKVEAKPRRARKLRFASHQSVLSDDQMTFRRESIYGDDAR
jgi:hypothetical protein